MPSFLKNGTPTLTNREITWGTNGLIMAARQLAGRRPLYFTEVCFYPLTYLIFSRRSLGRSSPNFATCSVVAVVYKTESEIWGSLPPKKLAAQKHQNVGLCDLIVNISGPEKTSSIGKRRWKLQSLPYVCTKIGELWITNGKK